MGKIKEFWRNKWVKFTIASLIYILWFVVWTGNPWLLLGELLIYDFYISKIFNKLVWSKHKKLKKGNHSYKFWMEWVEAILFATVAATIIRIFIFEMYVIPTPSMEKSLLVGDYLCVSKVAYGPKMPNTPVSFPFVHNTMPFSTTKKSYSECIKWPYHRLAGWGDVKRNDVVVFNFPAGDTVMLEDQQSSYYDKLRQYEAMHGPKKGREQLWRQYTIVARPVDKRENYVKRCVGIPGDTIFIEGSQLFVNGQPQIPIPAMQYIYFVRTNGTPISKKAFEKMGISNESISFDQIEKSYILPLTKANAELIAKMNNIEQVMQYVGEGAPADIFPNDARYPWNVDHFGPLWVPSRGTTVALTPDNLPLYRRIIEVYEGNTLEIKENALQVADAPIAGDTLDVVEQTIYINGEPADSYTFRMNYYFMMGDNRHNSADSRFWGFVPEDHVVGKASFVWFSTDKEKGWFSGKIRFSRMFRGTERLQNR